MLVFCLLCFQASPGVLEGEGEKMKEAVTIRLITDAGLAATSSAEGGSEGAKSDPFRSFLQKRWAGREAVGEPPAPLCWSHRRAPTDTNHKGFIARKYNWMQRWEEPCVWGRGELPPDKRWESSRSSKIGDVIPHCFWMRWQDGICPRTERVPRLPVAVGDERTFQYLFSFSWFQPDCPSSA